MKLPLHHRLYLRIWLAIVGTVFVLALLAGWIARLELEHEHAQRPGREILVRNDQGELLAQADVRPIRNPGQALEFQIALRDGTTLLIQLPRPANRSPAVGAMRPPFGFAWLLALVALAVALGTYPIVRRLTKRLEALELGVRRWGEGDLSLRLSELGHDEVAALAKGFNVAAHRVQALLLSHKALLANASHELRSPLTRIRMGLELMDAQPAAHLKDEIARSIQELDQLIDEILLASRLDASETAIGTMEPVDLLALAAEECALVGAELDARGEAAGLTVLGVPKLLRRLLRNLLDNARRHASSKVSLQMRCEAAELVLQVCDDGPGVPANLRERIFEPFYRLPGATERDGGVGLGLALVRSIAQRHGGTVSCEAAPAGGAVFVLRLPHRSAEAA